MNVIALSMSAWRYHRTKSIAIIEGFNEANSDEFVLIMKDTASREKLSSSAVYEVIDLRNFLDFGNSPDGILDIHKIRELPFTISSDKVVVINAAASRPLLIEQFLYQCRYGWYELEDWHIAFVLIVDESIIFDIATSLSNTFYIQPEILTDSELRTRVRKIMRAAKVLRYFGHKIGRMHRLILAFYDRRDIQKTKKDIEI
jgi:hypothetical protein